MKIALKKNVFFVFMFLIVVLPLVMVFYSYQLPVSNQKLYIDLSGQWLIHEGSYAEATNKGTDPSAWKSYTIPGRHYLIGFKNPYCVIKKDFQLPDDLTNKNLFLVAGSIPAGTAKVFINGFFTGEFGLFDIMKKEKGLSSINGLVINKHQLKVGSNTIELLLHQAVPGFDGFPERLFYIGDYHSLFPYYLNITFIHEFFQYGFIFYCFLMLFIINYLMINEEKSKYIRVYQSILFLLLASLFYNIIFSGAFIHDILNFDQINRLLICSIIILMIAFSEFIMNYYFDKVLFIFKIQRYLLLALIVPMLIFPDSVTRLILYNLFAVYSIVILIILTALSLYQSLFRSKKTFDMLIFFVVMVSALSAIADLLSNLGILNWPLFFNITLSCFAIIASVVVLADFINISVMNKKLTLTLSTANEDLKALDRLKDDFLANTSHELKTPLNGIIGLADSLLDGVAGTLNTSVKKNLSLIMLSGKKLLHLINDILDFSKMKDQSLNIEPRTIDIRTSVNVVMTQLKPLIQDKNLELLNLIPVTTPFIYADENRLDQILYNLIGNAIQFTLKGWVRADATIRENYLQVCIEDTGIGLDEKYQRIITDEYDINETPHTREREGTVFGLYITRRLVELQGGKLWVETKRNIGSKFYFTVPLALQKEITDETKVSSQDESDNIFLFKVGNEESTPELNDFELTVAAGSEVMVVDDDPINIQVLKNVLKMGGYMTRTFISGYDAQEYLKNNNPPEILLLDVMMPGLSGYDVTRNIRSKYPLYELPIIMLTAKNRIIDVITCLEAGANDYLSKPFDKKELFARIQNQLILKKAVYEHKRLTEVDQDLSIAMTVQKAILTQRETLDAINGVEIDACYKPMNKKVSGDYYNIHLLGDGCLSFFISDASGHGLQAALSTMQMDVLVKESMDIVSPEKKLQFINKMLTKYLNNENFFTAFALVYQDNFIEYSSAGHPRQLLARKEKEGYKLESLKSPGGPLGVLKRTEYHKRTIPIHSGDYLFLFTDGLFEEFDTNKAELGEDGLYLGLAEKFISNQNQL